MFHTRNFMETMHKTITFFKISLTWTRITEFIISNFLEMVKLGCECTIFIVWELEQTKAFTICQHSLWGESGLHFTAYCTCITVYVKNNLWNLNLSPAPKLEVWQSLCKGHCILLSCHTEPHRLITFCVFVHFTPTLVKLFKGQKFPHHSKGDGLCLEKKKKSIYDFSDISWGFM